MKQLTVTNLTKTYRTAQQLTSVLGPLSLSLRSEEFVCILGPNGCGKSSLLKILAGITSQTDGELQVPTAVAYLPQQPSLLPWRTVEQNLYLPADVQGGPDQATKAKVKKLLKKFGLWEFADYYPSALSGGMQQKVALLRTVMMEPQLMLLDEPFAALDAITRLSLQSWLLDLWQQQKSSVICVTHDIREAMLLADTIYVLSGRPGHIRLKLAVDLPRPRQPRDLTSPAAIRLEKKLRKLLIA